MINLAKAIIQKEDKYLLLQRSFKSHFFPSQYDFPGGKIKEGEKTEDAIIREVKEETSLSIELGEKIGNYQFVAMDNKLHFQIFESKSFTGDIELSEDHTEAIWVSKKDLKLYDLAPIVKLYFEE
ncbi:NUDIX domain-containing protein [Patescibacteria group bacterium]|nr:NUDIX domain-containing protein [Patescibacteria group bacterium]